MKKIITLIAILSISVLFTGCSQNQNILGPSEEPVSEEDRELPPDLDDLDVDREEPVSEEDRELLPDLDADREIPVSEEDRELPPELREMPVSEEDRELPPELEDLNIEPERIGGSCNMISQNSTCIDYVGNFWTETQMKYNCYSGTVSFNSCESGNIGGCNILKGSDTETIIWMYPYGGSPISGDSVQSAKPSCDINPMGNWLSAR